MEINLEIVERLFSAEIIIKRSYNAEIFVKNSEYLFTYLNDSTIKILIYETCNRLSEFVYSVEQLGLEWQANKLNIVQILIT